MTKGLSVICGGIVCLWSALARAQTFPIDGAWTGLPCGAFVMSDAYRDQPNYFDVRDLVGNTGAAAGLRAFDADFVYWRIRLDRDPAPAGIWRPFTWGVELDLDDNPATYELLLAVDGGRGEVAIYRNTVTTSPDDPRDPADLPAVAVHSIATHARSIVATGSSFGGDPDYFLDFALPWAELAPLGLTRTTPLRAWVASSVTANALDGDFACHDGGGPAARFDNIATTLTTVDPAATPGGGAGGSRVIEGGPGCALGGHAVRRTTATAWPLMAWLLALAVSAWRRHPRPLSAGCADRRCSPRCR